MLHLSHNRLDDLPGLTSIPISLSTDDLALVLFWTSRTGEVPETRGGEGSEPRLAVGSEGDIDFPLGRFVGGAGFDHIEHLERTFPGDEGSWQTSSIRSKLRWEVRADEDRLAFHKFVGIRQRLRLDDG